MEERRIIIIGLGGVGSWVVQGLAPFLNYSSGDHVYSLILVDGDEYEEKNRTRQWFEDLGPKAEIQANWVNKRFPKLSALPITQYLATFDSEDTRDIAGVVQNGDVVFSCVDNHATRKMIATYCGGLRDCVLISGGNEYTDGNVQLFIRRNNSNLTPTIMQYHPEIENPTDKPPYEMSCEELAASAPQLIFANMMVAALMLNVFYGVMQNTTNMAKSEVYFDIISNSVASRERKRK